MPRSLARWPLRDVIFLFGANSSSQILFCCVQILCFLKDMLSGGLFFFYIFIFFPNYNNVILHLKRK